MEHCELFIIGAGAAGLSAAKAAWEGGVRDIVIADSRPYPGGVLPQCTHRGFGGLDGREFLSALLSEFPKEIKRLESCTVLSLSKDRRALIAHGGLGRRELGFKAAILATGSYEIPAGALPIAGTRPRGVYTAGQMQEMVNLHGYIPKGPAVILGGGDLGLIMAARLCTMGLEVSVIERENSFGALARNQRELEPFPVRAVFGQSIRELHGERELESVTLTDGSCIPCSTLLIAAGLKRERSLLRGLESADWLFLCGNCERIHPMIEGVINQGKEAGERACRYIKEA